MSNNPVLNIIVCAGALLVLGLICSFFVILSAHKEEIWEEMYDRYIRGEKDDR
jgi:hypothetical protein